MPRFSLFVLPFVLIISLVGSPASAQESGDTHPDHGPRGDYPRPDHPVPGELPTRYPDRIALTWAEDPATSLSVAWRTDTTVTTAQAQVALAKAESSFYTRSETVEATTKVVDLTPVDDEYVKAKYHSATFTGLRPGTQYAYRVGDGNHWSAWFQTRTANDSPDAMSFLYLGDIQTNITTHGSRVVRAAYRKAPDARFMIWAGDLIDNAHRNIQGGQWHQAGGFIQSMVPNVPVPGNHEYEEFRTWTERDTFAISTRLSGSKMEGTLTRPVWGGIPLVATREGAVPDARYPAGEWKYSIDGGEYEGTLRIEQESDGLGGVFVSRDGAEHRLQNVTADQETLSAEFLMEVEKEGPEHLSMMWRPGFALPMNGAKGFKESTYFLDVQGVRVIGLNAEPATEDSTALAVQTAWLDSVLTNNPNPWTVATFHHPIFSSSEERDNPELRAAWKPLFDEHGVDLVLQGHDHTYARGRAENPFQEGQDGTMYVNSVAGAKMYDIKPDRWQGYDSIEMERAAENTQLFQVVRVDGDTLRFQAYTVTGELYDDFELIKRGTGEPNAFISHLPPGAPERTHENTIPFERP